MPVTPQTPFGTEPIVDRTAETDPRVYGGAMTQEGILLHHTGSRNEDGDYQWLSRYHDDPVSIHQLVKRDGTIVQIVPDTRVAWHAGESSWKGRGECNSYMIGIEICNAGDGTEAYTDAQYEAVARTVAYKCALYGIGDDWVTSHARVALPVGRKTDPLGWDWARMWQRIDEIRSQWPLREWHIPLIKAVPRVMSTA